MAFQFHGVNFWLICVSELFIVLFLIIQTNVASKVSTEYFEGSLSQFPTTSQEYSDLQTFDSEGSQRQFLDSWRPLKNRRIHPKVKGRVKVRSFRTRNKCHKRRSCHNCKSHFQRLRNRKQRIINDMRNIKIEGERLRPMRNLKMLDDILDNNFKLEVDEGGFGVKTVGMKKKTLEKLRDCNFIARLASDPSSIVSVSNCNNAADGSQGNVQAVIVSQKSRNTNVYRAHFIDSTKGSLHMKGEASPRIKLVNDEIKVNLERFRSSIQPYGGFRSRWRNRYRNRQRRKRVTRIIQLFVFVDIALFEQMKVRHRTRNDRVMKEELVKMVMGLVNTASAYTLHRSFGAKFRLTIVRIRILKNGGVSPSGSNILYDFQDYLKKREGAISRNRKGGGNMKVLLTGTTQMDSDGKAFVGTLCQIPELSLMALKFHWNKHPHSTEYKVGAMGQIFAHEIAHVMGVTHDGEGNRCSKHPGANKLMTPMVSSQSTTWSKCTRKKIRFNVNSNYYSCLSEYDGHKIHRNKESF